jgi:hypothetical protein
MAVQNKKAVEKCVKLFGKDSQFRAGKELYKVDFDTLKDISFSCGEMGKKFSKKDCKDCNAYVIFDETKGDLYLDSNSKLNKEIGKKNVRRVSKSGSKKVIKRSSKLGSKKVIKRSSKLGSKRGLKKTTKRSSKANSKKAIKRSSKASSKKVSK